MSQTTNNVIVGNKAIALYPSDLHPVNISPNYLERNVESLIVVNNGFYFAPISVAPSTLVESKSQILLHRWQADGSFLILLRYSWLVWTREEVKVDTSTQ